MKWLFLLLLIINLGIFAWGYQQEQLEQEIPVAAGSDVGDMRLLTEVVDTQEATDQQATQEQEQEQEPEASSLEMVPTPAHEQQPEISSQEPEPESEPKLEDKPELSASSINEVLEPDVEEQSDTEQVAAETADTEPVPPQQAKAEAEAEVEAQAESDVEGPVEPNAQPESDTVIAPKEQVAVIDTGTLPTELERPVADDKPLPVKSQIVSRCGSIGPIKDRKVAKEILGELKKSKFDAKLERSVEKLQIGFWVVIPPMIDGSQAQAKIDELTKAGVKDIWHFRGGGLKNAISLGMFSKRENAESYSLKVLQKGFKTKVQPRYLNKANYLVKFTISEPKTVTRLMWRMVERKYSKMPFSEQSCEPIATR